MSLNVKLEAFEGPLDLLLHLIEKNKLNIYDIPIVVITDQYLEYIDEMKRRDLDVMSEFLVMAATLLSIKSKMLLPHEPSEDDEEELDPRAELVQQLLEYKMYKCMAGELKDKQIDADHVMYKLPTIPDEVLEYEEPVELSELLEGITLTKLNSIFKEVLRREKSRMDPIRSKFGEIKKEEISLDDKMASLREYCLTHSNFSFRVLLSEQHGKTEVIVTFLAVLELIKSGGIRISQENIFDDIIIESLIADRSEAA